MNPKLNRWHRIPLGVCNTYLLEGPEGAVLVDAGPRTCEWLFFNYLKKNVIEPSRIRLIVITHAHFDHVGGLKKIKDGCDCPIAMHPADAEVVRRGDMIFPPGTNAFGKVASALGRLLGGPLVQYTPVEADMLVSEEINLRPFGVDARIIPTPGHTNGSLSVLLSDGACFIGDTASNVCPVRKGRGMPPFAEDVPTLLRSWKRLLRRGAKWIYPGHGKPFKADRLRSEMRRRDLDRL